MAAQDILMRYGAEAQAYDIALLDGDLQGDGTMGTWVLVSLLTDARASADELPPEYDDPRGWWADGASGFALGSRLWTLFRSKQTPAVTAAAEQYARDALRWLTAEGYARDVQVTVEDSVQGRLEMLVEITHASPPLARRSTEKWRAVLEQDGTATITGDDA